MTLQPMPEFMTLVITPGKLQKCYKLYAIIYVIIYFIIYVIIIVYAIIYGGGAIFA